ncbi:DUF3618 domain-containing protein [Micromonospora sp. KC723]|uniref:DUF3618 domain-containing protein n=1 Tax=Micromonospora sp. KC723 TaxID=2530381 RepID=UPI00104B7F20|nr:DUF3618 domain-containing protein [Micromonospora sp. KC723]TDB69891.1 DUF3618 domain-containing protein [Micromonospora sp. KC723]
MSNDPDRIRHDIETTRADLRDDVNALAYKANPRRIAADQTTRARGRLSRAVDRVMGTARHTRANAVRQSSAVRHRLSNTAHHGAEAATGAARQASDAVSGMTHRSAEVMTGAAHRTSDALTAAGHRAQTLTDASRERAQGNPLAAGLIAFGAGLLAASLVPPSRKERDLAERAQHEVEEHSGQVKQQAATMMHQAQDNLREPAQQASEAVRFTAAEGTAAVRDTGRDQARRVRDDARDAP